PTGQRFWRAWDVDVSPGPLGAAREALTMAYQLVRVFDCGRAPSKRDGRNQPNRQDARISHRQLAPSRIRGWPVFRSESSQLSGRERQRSRLILKFSRWSCAGAGNVGQPSLEMVPLSAFKK